MRGDWCASAMERGQQASFYRTPPRRLIGDYLRAAGGVLFGLALLLFGEPDTTISIIFAGIVLVFGYFGLRTWRTQQTVVAVNDQGIATRWLSSVALPWAELEKVRLRFYGTRRQHRRSDLDGGFLELHLAGAGKRLKIDSSLQGFRTVAWFAARAARERALPLDPATASNFLGIGIDPDSAEPPPDDEPLS